MWERPHTSFHREFHFFPPLLSGSAKQNFLPSHQPIPSTIITTIISTIIRAADYVTSFFPSWIGNRLFFPDRKSLRISLDSLETNYNGNIPLERKERLTNMSDYLIFLTSQSIWGEEKFLPLYFSPLSFFLCFYCLSIIFDITYHKMWCDFE